MIQDARGWCTGMTQRDGTGREEGGGIRMGNTCIPVLKFLLRNALIVVRQSFVDYNLLFFCFNFGSFIIMRLG